MSQDFNKSFAKIVERSFYRYRGVLFERTKEGFSRNGFFYKTTEEMDKFIDEASDGITDSLNRLKK
jgi:hypothetical protein